MSKNDLLAGVSQRLDEYLHGYEPYFKVYRRENAPTARAYLDGLLVCEKGQANMERMEEHVSGSVYRHYQHFLSNSPWDPVPIFHQVAHDMSAVCVTQKAKNFLPTGLIVDESATIKKGNDSVGVGRQYAGVVGKVENCQVGVYASLCNDTSATLVNERLFLPESWADDPERCTKAGIPEHAQPHQTKPQLALSMIDELDNLGIQWDWIGGDGLYGHSYELTTGLDERGLFYVLDVHKDELIYEEEPQLAVPPRRHVHGPTPTKLRADRDPIRLDRYCVKLPKESWELVKIRKGEKGWLKRYVHVATVWVWDGEEDHARRRTLVISKTPGRKPKTKYSLSNGTLDDYTVREYAYFQAQRYWVERCFDDAKNELGMSDYHVRKWQGWHHHHALVMMASLFLLKERLSQQEVVPLMSLRDVRLLIIARLFGTDEDVETCLTQMRVRHDKRQKSIDWWYVWDKE
jgi:SRSO17 transposase